MARPGMLGPARRHTSGEMPMAPVIEVGGRIGPGPGQPAEACRLQSQPEPEEIQRRLSFCQPAASQRGRCGSPRMTAPQR